MIKTIEEQENLVLYEKEISSIETKDGAISYVTDIDGNEYYCDAAVIATGTFLGGKIFIGDLKPVLLQE